MRLHHLVEADLGRRGFLRGLMGAAASPSSVAKMALGAAATSLVSKWGSAIGAYKKSGISDETLSDFLGVLQRVPIGQAHEITKSELIGTQPGNEQPNPYFGITPQILSGFLADKMSSRGAFDVLSSLSGMYRAIDPKAPLAKQMAYHWGGANMTSIDHYVRGAFADMLVDAKEGVNKWITNQLLPGHVAPKNKLGMAPTYVDSNPIQRLKDIAPELVPFTNQEIRQTMGAAPSGAKKWAELLREKGFIDQAKYDDVIKAIDEYSTLSAQKYKEQLAGYEAQRKERKKERSRVAREKKKKLKHEIERGEAIGKETEQERERRVERGVQLPMTSKPFMLRRGGEGFPSRPIKPFESFEKQLDKVL